MELLSSSDLRDMQRDSPEYSASCPGGLIIASNPGGIDVKENPYTSSSKLRVECDDIQEKTAGRNAHPLRKENHNFSLHL